MPADICEELPGRKCVLNISTMGIPDSIRIEEVLARIKNETRILNSSLGRVRDKLMNVSNHKLDEIRSRLDQFDARSQQLPTKVDIYRMLSEFNDSLVQKSSQMIQSEIRGILQELSPEYFAASLKTALFQAIRADPPPNRELEYHPVSPSSNMAPRIAKSDLLDALRFEPEDITRGLRLVLQQAFRMDHTSQARAAWLLETPTFRNWISTAHSSLLLVDGMSSGVEKISPMSVLVASVAARLFENSLAVPTYFFCGINLESDFELGRPQGPRLMLRSLIVQLLLSESMSEPKWNMTKSDRLLSAVSECDLDALWEVFWVLSRQFAQEFTVFCLLDGISWYERDQWIEDLRWLVSKFQSVVHQGVEGPAIKILMTSPNMSMEIRRQVDPASQYVNLGAGNLGPMPMVGQPASPCTVFTPRGFF